MKAWPTTKKKSLNADFLQVLFLGFWLLLLMKAVIAMNCDGYNKIQAH